MDKQRKKELKNMGKQLVEEYSAQVRERLTEENPFHYTDPRWVENYKDIYYRNKDFRLNTDVVLNEADLGEPVRLKILGYKFEGVLVPKKGDYILCASCRSLVPTWATEPLICKCGNIYIDLKNKNVVLPAPDLYSVVNIEALGNIRKTKPWWKFW